MPGRKRQIGAVWLPSMPNKGGKWCWAGSDVLQSLDIYHDRDTVELNW